MVKQVIVTDSTSDLPQSYLKENSINVIPLNVTIDGKSYIDQIEITSEEYIEYMEQDADVKTSQPAIGEFINLYEELAGDDVEIISIHMSSGLSGTYNTAYQASEMVDANVTVIDSKSISNGLAYQIKHIVELIEQGTSTTDIVKSVKELQENTKLFVVIGQLNQLIKEDNIEYFYKEFNGGHHWKSWKPLLGDILLQFLGNPINGKYV